MRTSPWVNCAEFELRLSLWRVSGGCQSVEKRDFPMGERHVHAVDIARVYTMNAIKNTDKHGFHSLLPWTLENRISTAGDLQHRVAWVVSQRGSSGLGSPVG